MIAIYVGASDKPALIILFFYVLDQILGDLRFLGNGIVKRIGRSTVINFQRWSLSLKHRINVSIQQLEMNPMKRSCIEFMQNREEPPSISLTTEPLDNSSKLKLKTLKVRSIRDEHLFSYLTSGEFTHPQEKINMKKSLFLDIPHENATSSQNIEDSKRLISSENPFLKMRKSLIQKEKNRHLWKKQSNGNFPQQQRNQNSSITFRQIRETQPGMAQTK